MFPSYTNQPVDLLCNSTDWFLYDGNIGRWKVKDIFIINSNGVFYSIIFWSPCYVCLSVRLVF